MTTATATATAPAPAAPRRRRRLTKRTAAIAALAVGAGTGSAYAAVIAQLNYGAGTIRTADFRVDWMDENPTATYGPTGTEHTTGAKITVDSYNGSTPVNPRPELTASTPPELYAGDSLRLTATARTRAGTGHLSGVTGNIADGWTARLDPADCGKAITSAGTPVTVVITPTADAAGTFTLSALKTTATSGTKPSNITCTTAGEEG